MPDSIFNTLAALAALYVAGVLGRGRLRPRAGVVSARTEPEILPSGRCYQCGGERPEGAVKNVDAFCAVDCCKAYYAGEPRGPRPAPTRKKTKEAA